MSAPIRVLFAEDNPDDAYLELHELRSRGLVVEHEVVETQASLEEALRRSAWDVVISDFRMPEMTGVDVIRIVKAHDQTLPVILVSGTVGEDIAVEMMRAGASDYVLKDNLTRLPSAVQREVGQAESRRDGHASRIGLRLFADAGAALAATLKVDAMLASLPRAIVGELAELCIVDVIRDGHAQRASLAHVDPAKGARVAELEATHAPAAAAPEPSDLAIARRTTLVLDLARPDAEVASSRFVAVARQLGLAASMTVPLIAEGHVVGALTLGARRAFHAVEIEVVEELARRIAISLENAVLYERARNAVEVRDQFLSIASHELKTPLMVLQLQLDSVEALRTTQPALPVGDAKLAPKLDMLHRQADRLAVLVDGLLHVTRIVSGRLDLQRESFDFGAAARAAIARVDASRSGSAIVVDVEPGLVGEWDRTHVETVITNLVSNAIKYGGGKAIDVRAQRAGDRLRLSVRDRGIGITAEQQSRIFERFERAVPPEHYGGLGLGLWIVRQIVSAHGGVVHVDSAPGAGSTFVVELPFREAR